MNLYSYANLGLWNRILFLRGSAEQRKQSCLDECAAGNTRRCAVCRIFWGKRIRFFFMQIV